MNIESLTKFWTLMHSIVLEFWGITEPHVEDSAVKNDVPIELYYYGELGLEYFSIEEFQKRDPFSNPEHFERMFARFDVKDWIFPLPDERYQVSNKARDAVREIIQAGDAQLTAFDLMSEEELKELLGLMKQLVTANLETPEPPEKWAIIKRFRVAGVSSPLIVQIRESLMDMFAYRDDAHLAAARPHFGQAGIVWNVLGSVAGGAAVNSALMAENMTFRGYEESDYDIAIQAAVEIGWIEPGNASNTFRLTPKGREIREQVEILTDEYFYRPWSVLTENEIDSLFALLTKLHEQLIDYRKSMEGESHL